MEITVSIKATELTSAILALAHAIEVHAHNALSSSNTLGTTMTVLADQLEESTKAKEVPAEWHDVAAKIVEEKPVEVMAIDITELRAAAKSKGTTVAGKKFIKGLLDSFGCKSISDVPEKDRLDFLEKLSAFHE